MKEKENLAQKVLVEVLIREVEALQKANKELQSAFPLIKGQIQELKNMPLIAQVNTQPLNTFNAQLEARLKQVESLVKVDTSSLESFQNRLDRRLQTGLVLPKWLLYSTIGLVFWALLATTFAVRYHGTSNRYESAQLQYYNQARNLQIELQQYQQQATERKSPATKRKR